MCALPRALGPDERRCPQVIASDMVLMSESGESSAAERANRHRNSDCATGFAVDSMAVTRGEKMYRWRLTYQTHLM
jgi:hypothetical protein